MKDSSNLVKESETVRTLRGLIQKETGIIINNERIIDLEIVLHNRLVVHKLDEEKYLEFFRNNYDELIVVASFFTIQETSFYRYKAHFDRLKIEIIPEIIRQKKDQERKSITILSAGCSTGEEPYTISMIVNDLINDINNWDVRIIATDINKNALQMAEHGIYSEYKLRNIDAWYINRYFEVQKNGKNSLFKIKDSVKRFVTFRHCNLIREPFELGILRDVDVIFCENVMIYFCHDSIQRLIANFYNILKQGGYLFLGYSETLNIVKHRFTLSWWQDSFNYRKDDEGEEPLPLPDNTECRIVLIEDENNPAGIKQNSYDDCIKLIVKNYRSGLQDNVLFLLRKIEHSQFTPDAVFYLIKAEFQFEQNDYINAANECRMAISLNPHSIDAHIMLGAIYLELDMLDSAIFEIKTVLFIDNKSVLGNYYYAVFNKKINNNTGYQDYIKNAHEILLEREGLLETDLYPVNPNTRKKIFDALVI